MLFRLRRGEHFGYGGADQLGGGHRASAGWLLEGCRSGRTGRSRKPLYPYGYRGFESHPLRQSAPPEFSLRRSRRQKSALFQKGLPERPETALAARRPISFSFQPVSLKGGDCANLVPMLDSLQYQWLDGWHVRPEFESASGWRRELGSEFVLACAVKETRPHLWLWLLRAHAARLHEAAALLPRKGRSGGADQLQQRHASMRPRYYCRKRGAVDDRARDCPLGASPGVQRWARAAPPLAHPRPRGPRRAPPHCRPGPLALSPTARSDSAGGSCCLDSAPSAREPL
jgi:hypothetical protein